MRNEFRIMQTVKKAIFFAVVRLSLHFRGAEKQQWQRISVAQQCNIALSFTDFDCHRCKQRIFYLATISLLSVCTPRNTHAQCQTATRSGHTHRAREWEREEKIHEKRGKKEKYAMILHYLQKVISHFPHFIWFYSANPGYSDKMRMRANQRE